MIGFLHPSEMTPEERIDELAEILADGILRLKTGVLCPKTQVQSAGAVALKSHCEAESSLDVSRHMRPDVARK